jgi:hypothetical protein
MKNEKCKYNGFHNWKVVGVSGTLPNQEIELMCEDCNATSETTIYYEDD